MRLASDLLQISVSRPEISFKREMMHEDTRQELSAPRFDEEATVLSARQVIPLAELPKKKWRAVRWQIAAVSLLAMLLVMTIGLVVGKRSSSSVQTTNADSVNEVQTASQTEAVAPKPVDQDQEVVAASEPESNTPRKAKPQPAKETKTVVVNAKKPEPVTRRRVVAEPVEEDNYDPAYEDWQARREARERRLERRARRENWMRRNPDSDGLFRVPDIFQGRRRRP
jgi:hypothetical protein